MTVSDSPIQTAEIIVPSSDIRDDLPFFTKTLGFRLEQIFPADDPAVAVLSGHGVRLRLDRAVPMKHPAHVCVCRLMTRLLSPMVSKSLRHQMAW